MGRWDQHTTHTDISDFCNIPHVNKKLRIRRLKIAAAIVTSVTIIGFSAKPVYLVFREFLINRNLEAAKAAALQQDWGTARNKARSVLVVKRENWDAFRIWARALAKMGEPRAYMAAAQLFTDKHATRDDRLEALQIMATQAPQAIALGAYASLSNELRDQAAFRAAITPLLVKRGAIDIAETGLREVSQANDGPEVRLELLRVLCARPEPGRVVEARGIFSELIARNADKEALDALLILGETPGGLAPGESLPDLPKWLKNQPKATALHHLIGMHPTLEALPEAADRLYETTVERFLSTEPGVLGTWLVRHGKAEMAVRILEEPAKKRTDAYIARLNAMLRLKQNDALDAALAVPPDSVDLVEMEIVRAVLAQSRGVAATAAAAWTRALNQASFDTTRNRFIEIAQIAKVFGATAAVDDAWVAAVRMGWGNLPLYRDLQSVFASLASQGRSEDVLAMCQTLLRFEQHNPELINNFNYLALLHGIVTPDQASKTLTKLVEASPDKPEFQSALMLAEMLEGHPVEALGRLEQLRKSPRVSPMMLSALEGTARLLAAETEVGTALLKDVRWSLFMRQERFVFRNMLIKLKIAGLALPELDAPITEANPDQIPAWRKAVERHEKDRAKDVLPALPKPRIPGAELLDMPLKEP